jgi:hypothetical protein
MIDPADTVTRPLPQPTRLHFTTDTRMYTVALQQDLLGDWTVMQSWGGKSSQRGGGKVCHVASFEAGAELLERIAKRRQAHGYCLTLPDICL